MHRDRPVTRLPIRTVHGNLPGLRSCLILLASASMMSAAAPAASATKTDAVGKTATAQEKDTASENSDGAHDCATCHKEIAKDFASNPHSKTTRMQGRNGVTCEDCHGAGKAHAESGDKAKILNPANESTKEVDAKCLKCHLAKHRGLDDSDHTASDVSCTGCHDIHHSKVESLLKASEPVLCYQCHTDVKPQFSNPFHHKVNEGLVQCSDCHDPHGTYKMKGRRSAIEQNAFCVRCHTETAGPFVYEHGAVKGEGCIACHVPHGGQNPHLLNRANVTSICLQCHAPLPNFTTPMPAGSHHTQAAQSQSCVVCHTSIHGSNVSPIFSKHVD